MPLHITIGTSLLSEKNGYGVLLLLRYISMCTAGGGKQHSLYKGGAFCRTHELWCWTSSGVELAIFLEFGPSVLNFPACTYRFGDGDRWMGLWMVVVLTGSQLKEVALIGWDDLQHESLKLQFFTIENAFFSENIHVSMDWWDSSEANLAKVFFWTADCDLARLQQRIRQFQK
jgi:hypothetical protein